MEIRTVIVGHRHLPPEGLRSLCRLEKGDRITLQREPENAHDPLAVRCVAPNHIAVGYLPRTANKDVAAALDAGKAVAAAIYLEAISEDGDVKFLPKIAIQIGDE